MNADFAKRYDIAPNGMGDKVTVYCKTCSRPEDPPFLFSMPVMNLQAALLMVLKHEMDNHSALTGG